VSEFDRRGGLTRVRAEGRPRRHLRLLTAILAALALALLAPAASLAGEDRSGRSGDNAAQAINEKAGSSVFDFAFSIRRVAGDVVDEQNSAVAYGSCVECQTVAIALQIVLVEGVPDSVTPTNVAIALNEECQACTTVALAYQFVVGRGGPVRFTKEGRRRLAEIRREFERLGRSGLSAEELTTRAKDLKDQVADVLATELVPVREGDDDAGEGDGDDAGSLGGDRGDEDGDRGSGKGSGDGGGSNSGDDQGGSGSGTGSDREPSTRDGAPSGGSGDKSEPGGATGDGSSGGGGSPPTPSGSAPSGGASP